MVNELLFDKLYASIDEWQTLVVKSEVKAEDGFVAWLVVTSQNRFRIFLFSKVIRLLGGNCAYTYSKKGKE